ncbi:MAG: efflux RND transporter periplasmic adaptor subunit [Candidatus Shapirobacteria bacterium]|jgi:RND family efflux transporter MFP subunit
MNKKWLLVVVFVSISSFGWYWFNTLSKAAPIEVKTATVTKGDLKISTEIDGATSVDRRDLKFNVNGKVSKVVVKEGQEVKKGQLLISLDTQDVQKNLESSLKDYSIARNTFDQTGQVTYADKVLTDTIKRSLDNSQYTLDKSVIAVELKNISLKESYLYAPIAGTVSAINIKEGEVTNTQNGGSVITITRQEGMSFESMAEDIDVLKITPDQKVEVRLDAIPNVVFPATIDFISTLAQVDQNGLSTYKVRVKVADFRGYKILDGMSGQAIFITKEKDNILVIPNKSVIRENGQSYVTKKSGDKSEKVVVVTGFTDGKSVEVVSGLAVGDVVVVL